MNECEHFEQYILRKLSKEEKIGLIRDAKRRKNIRLLESLEDLFTGVSEEFGGISKSEITHVLLGVNYSPLNIKSNEPIEN